MICRQLQGVFLARYADRYVTVKHRHRALFERMKQVVKKCSPPIAIQQIKRCINRHKGFTGAKTACKANARIVTDGIRLDLDKQDHTD